MGSWVTTAFGSAQDYNWNGMFCGIVSDYIEEALDCGDVMQGGEAVSQGLQVY